MKSCKNYKTLSFKQVSTYFISCIINTNIFLPLSINNSKCRKFSLQSTYFHILVFDFSSQTQCKIFDNKISGNISIYEPYSCLKLTPLKVKHYRSFTIMTCLQCSLDIFYINSRYPYFCVRFSWSLNYD